MKRPIVIATSVVAFLSLSIWLAPASGAAVQRFYRGETEQGKTVRVTLVNRASGLYLTDLQMAGRLDCENGSRQRIRAFYSYGGKGLALTDSMLAIDDVSSLEAFHVHGTFGPRKGSGTLDWTVPSLASEEEAQICTTGVVDWTVSRLTAAATSSSTPSRTGVTVREVVNGHVIEWHRAA
jgi:hypothetical protein